MEVKKKLLNVIKWNGMEKRRVAKLKRGEERREEYDGTEEKGKEGLKRRRKERRRGG